jgi:hypothetical protein
MVIECEHVPDVVEVMRDGLDTRDLPVAQDSLPGGGPVQLVCQVAAIGSPKHAIFLNIELKIV